VKDFKDLHDMLLDAKSILLDQFFRKIGAIFLYIFNWRCKPLSLIALLHWWTCVLFPSCLLPSLPLWAAALVKALRDPKWRNDLLVHEATAPLNEEGFKMMAAFNRSEPMCTWLRRLVDDRGGKVKDSQELAEFAKLTFRDGQPALFFEPLLCELKRKRWIAWNTGKERRCPEEHVLELWGSGSYQQQHIWKCQGHSSDCLVSGRARLGLHLGVSRYHCRSCKKDMCKACTSGESVETSILSTVVPIIGFESVKDMVFEAQEVVRGIRDNSVLCCQQVEDVLTPNATASAWTIYASSLLMSIAIAILTIVTGDLVSQLVRLLWQALCLLLGTAVLTQNTAWARRMVTVSRANWDFLSARERRLKGGCKAWAFCSQESQTFSYLGGLLAQK